MASPCKLPRSKPLPEPQPPTLTLARGARTAPSLFECLSGRRHVPVASTGLDVVLAHCVAIHNDYLASSVFTFGLALTLFRHPGRNARFAASAEAISLDADGIQGLMQTHGLLRPVSAKARSVGQFNDPLSRRWARPAAYPRPIQEFRHPPHK